MVKTFSLLIVSFALKFRYPLYRGYLPCSVEPVKNHRPVATLS